MGCNMQNMYSLIEKKMHCVKSFFKMPDKFKSKSCMFILCVNLTLVKRQQLQTGIDFIVFKC